MNFNCKEMLKFKRDFSKSEKNFGTGFMAEGVES